MKLIGVDVGGTFTDVVHADTERNETLIHKVATTPDDPSVGVMTGILELCERAGIAPETIDHPLVLDNPESKANAGPARSCKSETVHKLFKRRVVANRSPFLINAD